MKNTLLMSLFLFSILFTTNLLKAQSDSIYGVKIDMVRVEGSIFIMGDKAYNDARPFKVKLSSFYMLSTEVTRVLWYAVMDSGKITDLKNKDFPKDNLNWNDTQEFIKKLNELTGKKYRLPTEAEWEFAARGGKMNKGFDYSGSNNLDEIAWFSDNSNNKPHPVAQKLANQIGIYDLNGNMMEWCQDWYAEFKSDAKIKKDPTGPVSGKDKVLRGGGYDNDAKECQISFRSLLTPELRHSSFGFRLVLPIE